jgi:hypothetical protein
VADDEVGIGEEVKPVFNVGVLFVPYGIRVVLPTVEVVDA